MTMNSNSNINGAASFAFFGGLTFRFITIGLRFVTLSRFRSRINSSLQQGLSRLSLNGGSRFSHNFIGSCGQGGGGQRWYLYCHGLPKMSNSLFSNYKTLSHQDYEVLFKQLVAKCEGIFNHLMLKYTLIKCESNFFKKEVVSPMIVVVKEAVL